MKPGDPWATDDRDAMRSEQRRVLRMLPAWIMERTQVPEPGRDVESGLAEHVLRVSAQRLIDQHRELLAECETRELARALREVLPPYDPREHRPLLEDLHEHARQQLRGGEVGDDDPDAYGVIEGLYVLLSLADLVADDGYHDPRARPA